MGDRLFGTDGIRGTANVEPMTSETVLRLGRAIAHVVKRSARRHKIIIGKDTRLSGYMLESALTSGICSMGVDVLLCGPIPTPGIAFLTRSMRADAGVMISASHNPFQDNGIKFFDSTGFKLADEVEREIEALVHNGANAAIRPTAEAIGKAFHLDDALGRYNVFLKNTFPRHLTLDGLKIVIDCAHGAAYRVGPEVLAELGADVLAMGDQPNGENINRERGALHPQALASRVRSEGAHLGVALDGDADRVILVDERGEVVDGDEVLAMLGLALHASGRLAGQAVVATVMSNLGLELALRERGVELIRVQVGDRYVVEEMVRGGYVLGGEQSGHIVSLEHGTTGDGLLTALSVLGLMVESGQPLSALRRAMQRLPQRLVNVRVRERREIDALPAVRQTIDRVTRDLAGRGRVLVRYSGTEPLVRVMVEGEQAGQVERYCEEIAAALRESVGTV
ncbi:MAG: phosphoglucosamine mutase [Deltaproteobacteria bacterium]|nr:phosphoglucosamine mutase [Deltaproteobacteria bacterium]